MAVHLYRNVALEGLFLLLIASGHAYDDSESESESKPEPELCDPTKQTTTGQFAIKWKSGHRPEDCKDFLEKFGIEMEWKWDWPGDWSVYQAEDVETANAIMEDISASIKGADLYGSGPISNPDVREALEVHVEGVFGSCPIPFNAVKPATVPTECSPNSCPNPGLWGLNEVRAPAVWAALPGQVNANPSVSVMVIDSGIRTTHRDLAPNLVPNLVVTAIGADGNAITPVRVPLTTPPANVNAMLHGTHVASILYGRWNNGGTDSPAGVVGNALGGSCGCAINNGLDAEFFCYVQCLQYAVTSRVRVINLSWGFSFRVDNPPAYINPMRDAISAFCTNGGIVTIAPNNGDKRPGGNRQVGVNIILPGWRDYPAAFAAELAGVNPTCIINVANLQRDGTLAQSSAYGQNVQVAAPGTQIFGAAVANDAATDVLSGTSMAAPLVAGMATLLFNAFQGATQAQVYNCIVSTATRPATPNPGTPGQQIAGGIVNLEAAYQCMRANPACPTTGLPPCVLPSSGQPVETCDTSRFCRAIPNSNRYLCQYSYRPENSLCPLPNTTPANQKTTCGQCRATVCVEASKKWCKTASKNARQAEIEASDAVTDSNVTQ